MITEMVSECDFLATAFISVDIPKVLILNFNTSIHILKNSMRVIKLYHEKSYTSPLMQMETMKS